MNTLRPNMVEQVGVEPTMFTTRERIYSPLQNTPYLQLLQNLMELVTGFEPAYNRFAICSLAFRVTPTFTINFADALFAMLNGITCKITVSVHSYSGLRPMAYVSKINGTAYG